MAQPVFYDPGRARWKRLRRLFDVLGVTITLLIVFFAYSALRSEQLPEVLLPQQKRPYHALIKKEKERAKERRRQVAHRTHRKSKTAPSQVKLNAEEGIRGAFYVPYDAASFSSLREYAHQIDLLFPVWLQVLTADGHLQAVDELTNKRFDVVQGSTLRAVDDKVMPFLRSEDTGMEVFPVVQNFNGSDFDPGVAAFLMDPAARAHFRQQIAAFLASDKYRGLMVDFEAFPKKAQPGYVALLGELANDLHGKGMKLYVSLQARNEDYDYAAISARADGIVVMNYDEHYPGGTPGPVASQDWFVDNLKAASKEIPHDKLICALANYGYDWPHRLKNGKLPAGMADTNVSVQEAWLGARDSEEDVEFDGDALNPHFSYLDESNLEHDIWFLDAVTALNQMRAAQALGIKTFALWRLGSEDRSLWRVWDAPGDPAAPDKLRDTPPGQDVDMEGGGEILRIEARPTNGQRDIIVDHNTGIITNQDFKSLPEPYRVARYGSSLKQLAITFDDGPDPQWTPRILDVLKREHAPATFFLIGMQADKFAGITSRIYDEGHEIGNHTFTHPNISDLSPR
ncbi:MAG TPA: polysaccharide deacetylase family protein, partial [Terriglobales bacterium]|nr:polysaccharide deacetylase family protein [Terriglobales bacterium]